jgi:hypothetical protein
MAAITLEDIEEARERTRAERAEQGLPPEVTDPGALSPIARALNCAIEATDIRRASRPSRGRAGKTARRSR